MKRRWLWASKSSYSLEMHQGIICLHVDLVLRRWLGLLTNSNRNRLPLIWIMRSLVKIMTKINFLSKWKESWVTLGPRMSNTNPKSKRPSTHLCCCQTSSKLEKASPGKTLTKWPLCNKTRASWKCKKCSTIIRRLAHRQGWGSLGWIATMYQAWRRVLRGKCRSGLICIAWEHVRMLTIRSIGRIRQTMSHSNQFPRRRQLLCGGSLERVKRCHRRFRFGLATKRLLQWTWARVQCLALRSTVPGTATWCWEGEETKAEVSTPAQRHRSPQPARNSTTPTSSPRQRSPGTYSNVPAA